MNRDGSTGSTTDRSIAFNNSIVHKTQNKVLKLENVYGIINLLRQTKVV